MSYFEEFKRNNTQLYIEAYKNGTRKEQEELKKNLYDNPYLTEQQKDKFWASIMKIVKNATL